MKTSKLDLTSLVHVKCSMKGKNGNAVQGIFLPFDNNHFYLTQKGSVILDLIHFKMAEVSYGNDHVTVQSLPKEIYEKMSKEEKDAKKPVGYSKLLEDGYAAQAPSQPNSSSRVEPEPEPALVEYPDDDLPF